MTIVAAWISAETGVGPSIASGQPDMQRELGALADRAREEQQGDERDRDRHGPARSVMDLDRLADVERRLAGQRPVFTKIAMIPSANPTSPTRFVMNAFLLASAALRLRYQKPIRR